MTNPLDAAIPSPAQEGFFMSAEWDTHSRTWMCWPTRAACFGGPEGLLRAKQAYARVARAISAFEPVVIAACADGAAEAKLATGGKAEVLEITIDDSWARDIGPTFLRDRDGRISGVQWRFNAWGNKYHPFANDAVFARHVLDLTGTAVFDAPMVCEGGAIHCDGQGTVLTTEQCLLNPNRNPHMSREDVEACLAQYVGARKVIWLGEGFSDTETDGHIDNIACFAGPGRVILGMPAKDHPDFDPATEARRRLLAATDAEGRRLEVVELPLPKKQRQSWSGALLPTSYVNFYLTNGAVIMPAFDDHNDEAARAILADCFPGRDIMQIAALDIVEGGGGIHCITQQEPQAAS
jgi:agmatine deiminase